MEWYEILLVVLLVLVVLYIIYFSQRSSKHRKLMNSLVDIIKTEKPDVNVNIHGSNMLYQIDFIKDKHYYIKILNMNPKHEIIITNSDKVVINGNIQGWKRSSHPNFVPGIKEMINLKTDIPVVKIILINPDCHNITKYINESDVYKVPKFQKVDWLYYVKINELKDFLKKH